LLDVRDFGVKKTRLVSRDFRVTLTEPLEMISNDQQLHTTLDRIAWFLNQVAHLRKTETNPVNYRASVSGFLAEIDRMQLEVREYFSFLPTETVEAT
jgi:hypothetical protein